MTDASKTLYCVTGAVCRSGCLPTQRECEGISESNYVELKRELSALQTENVKLKEDIAKSLCSALVQCPACGEWQEVNYQHEAWAEIKYLKGELARLKEEYEHKSAMAQVCLDLHDALGVRWGDNPYSRIAELTAAALQSENVKLKEELQATINAKMVEFSTEAFKIANETIGRLREECEALRKDDIERAEDMQSLYSDFSDHESRLMHVYEKQMAALVTPSMKFPEWLAAIDAALAAKEPK